MGLTRRLSLLAIILCAVPLAAVEGPGARPAGADSGFRLLPNPRIFRIPPADFPWRTDYLLEARKESNARAAKDARIIYAPSSSVPDWDALKRLLGWYEQADMTQGEMQPQVTILVSEYRWISQARRAFAAEKRFRASRRVTSSPPLGTESVEYASSYATNRKTQRAEYSVIYTRDQNIELDVAVSETHAPQYRWLHNYRFAALALATRLVSIADRALQATPTSTGTATLTPTSTATPTRTSSPTSTPTLTPAPTPTNRPPTVVTSTPIGTAKPTAISTPTATPTITAHPVITGPPPGRASRQGPD